MVLVHLAIYLLTLSSRPRSSAARWRCTSLSTCTDEHCVCALASCAAGLCLRRYWCRARLPRAYRYLRLLRNWTARKAWDSPLRLIMWGERARGSRGLLLKPCEPYVGHSTRGQDRAGISIRGAVDDDRMPPSLALGLPIWAQGCQARTVQVHESDLYLALQYARCETYRAVCCCICECEPGACQCCSALTLHRASLTVRSE
jgi:hypothetical protein